MTQDALLKVQRRIAYKSCFFAGMLTLFFGFLGEGLFELFHITVDGLKAAGGVIFFSMGYDMLGARVARIKISKEMKESELEEADDIAITPIAIPLCGPGAITSAILLMSETDDSLGKKVGFCLGVIAIFAMTLFCFLGAEKIVGVIGKNGNKVVLRLMGLLLMILAVESFFGGLTPILREIFKIT